MSCISFQGVQLSLVLYWDSLIKGENYMIGQVPSSQDKSGLLCPSDITLTDSQFKGCMVMGGVGAVATVVAIGVISMPALILGGIVGITTWYSSTEICKLAVAIYTNGVNGHEWITAASLICTLVFSLVIWIDAPPLTLTNFVFVILFGSSVNGMVGAVFYEVFASVSNRFS